MEEANTKVKINPTDLSNIFIPHGNLIPKADLATIKMMVNVSAIFDESREMRRILDVNPEDKMMMMDLKIDKPAPIMYES